jgi:lysophospholipase L1-like esterase
MALFSLLATLAFVEVMLRIFHPLPDPYRMRKVASEIPWPGSPYVPSAFPANYRRVQHAEPGLPGVDTLPHRFSTNNYGYRGDSLAMPKPAGEVRVFMVGGSTTECIVLDDSAAVSARLQQHLRALLPGVDVRVYGAGKSGDRSWDHVAMTGHRIAHLQPDVVIVFAGVNDALAAVTGRDYLLRGDPQPIGAGWLVRELATETQVARLFQAALGNSNPADVDVHTHYRAAVRYVGKLPLTDRKPPENTPPYADNLRSLAGIVRANHARPVFMTQATSWNTPDPRLRRWHWMLGGSHRYREADLDALMGRYNDVMKAVGTEQAVPVFDFASSVPKSTDVFYDDVHFNTRGADTAAALLARFIVDHGIIAPPK